MDIRLLVVIGYMIMLLWVGNVSGKKIKGFSDFLVGGRAFGWFPIAMTFAAAWTGGAACTAMIGTAYTKGLSALWWWWAIVIPYVINGLLLAGPIRRSKAPTVAALLSARYDHRVSLVAAITQTIGYVFLNCAQVVAGGLFLQTLLGVPLLWGTILTAVVVLIYTVLGGLIACTVSDVLQQFVSIGAFIGALVFLGSNSVVRLSDLPPSMLSLSAGFDTRQFITWILSFGAGHFGMQSTFMRVAQARNERQAKIGQLMGGFVLFVVSWLVALVGMWCNLDFGPGLASNQVATTLVMKLPALLGGLYAAGVLSAVMSTTDSNLLASTGMFSRDVYAKYINKNADDDTVLRLSRILCVPAIAIAIVGGIYLPDIVGWITKGMAMNGMVSVSVLAGLYWKRATSEGAFASTLGGMITYLIWTFSGNPRGINAVIPGLIVGIVLLIGVSLFTEPKDEATIDSIWSGELSTEDATVN